MQVDITAADLSAFEEDVARRFLDKQIRFPVHLEGGSEEALIQLFRNCVEEEDWLLCSWRSHLKCLLKGVPSDKLLSLIVAGHSIALCFPEYRILSSAIAGGTAPIAVGLAMGIRRKGEYRKVVCFLGDMTARMGVVQESMQYARNFQLPVLWVVEDNGISTEAVTEEVWGSGKEFTGPSTVHYHYQNRWPHVGAGRWVTF